MFSFDRENHDRYKTSDNLQLNIFMSEILDKED